MEDALHPRDERLALALDSGSDRLWDWSVGTGRAWFSECWYATLGSRMHLAYLDDAERATAIMSRHLKAQSPAYECKFRLLRKDGAYAWVFCAAR